VAAVRRKETGHWGGVQGRHECTPAKLGSGSRSGGHGRVRHRAAGCLGSASLHAAKTGTAGWAALFSWAVSSQLGRAGMGEKGHRRRRREEKKRRKEKKEKNMKIFLNLKISKK
jgi:hypothetical protein